MVEPVTTATSLGLGGAGLYLLQRYWKNRKEHLRALALAAKYSTTTRIASHEGSMRLLVSLPQVGEVPANEQEAWRARDERRNRNFLELDLIHSNLEDPTAPESNEEPDEGERLMELEARSSWIESNEPPMNAHAALVAEEQLGSGVVIAEESDEEQEVNIDERLEREGGESGVVQVSLAWDDFNDLDLHVFCPSGERIYFNNKQSECGGILDVDMNVRPVSNTPIENVVWKDTAPLGAYKIGVHFYKHHKKRRTKRLCNYRLRVITHGKSKEYLGSIKYGQAMQMVTSFSLEEAPEPQAQ
jgi:hypothetical protein